MILASLIFTVGISATMADDVARPNIVLILADDLGRGDLGGTVAPTPRLDRMASEGTRLNRYYSAAPICSPSRCGLLTGQFPGRWRINSYLQTRAGNRACSQADFLDPKAPTLPKALKAAGYATLHVGKWHLGGGRDVVDAPKFAAYGYEAGLGTWESPEPHPDITAADWIWSDKDPVKRWDRSRWMVDRSLEFLGTHLDRPCFINLWLDDPHTPWVPSEADQTRNKDGRTVGKEATPERLRGVLVEMDRQIGRLLDALSQPKPGVRPTIVLFLSDNGPLPPFPHQKRTGGLRGSKLSLYEGGIRLPFIAWGPGLVAPGRTDDETVLSAVDLFPTICRLAGAELPPGYHSDGEDLSAAILGRAAVTRTKPLYWEYGRNTTSFDYPKASNRSPNVATLDGRWKLLVNADGSGAELYDIFRDPSESTNRAAEEPVVTDRLKSAAMRWRAALP